MSLPKPKPGEPVGVIYPGPLYEPVEVPAEYVRDMRPESQGGLSYEALCAKWYPSKKPESAAKPRNDKAVSKDRVRHRPDCPTLKQAGGELVRAFTNFFSLRNL